MIVQRHGAAGTEQRDRDERSASYAVIEAVATREQATVASLPPLSDVVDTDALDALFRPRPDGTPRRGGTVQVGYCGYTVTVAADGRVTLDQPDG
ncbi:MAG: HalOD1 output domain-containing protein [Haloarculaceae archaeon]